MNRELNEVEESFDHQHSFDNVEELTMLLAVDPDNTRTLFLRAVSYQRRGDYAQALEDYDRLLTLSPRHAKAYYNVGMISAFKQYNRQRALKAFDEFLSIEPRHAKAFSAVKVMCAIDRAGWRGELNADLKQGERLEAAGDEEGALRHYHALLERFPTLAEAHHALGRLFLKRKQSREASLHFVKASLFYRQKRKELCCETDSPIRDKEI